MLRLHAAPAGDLVGRDQNMEQGLRPDSRSLGSQHGLTCILYRSLLVPKPSDRVGPSKKTGVFLSLHNLSP